MNIDITEIIKAIILVIGALITTFLIPYIKSHSTESQRTEIIKWSKIACSCAEQIFKDSGMGAKKKAYVLDFLESMGYEIDTEEVNAIIEAVVKEINGGIEIC